jgi:hypothetical protein
MTDNTPCKGVAGVRLEEHAAPDVLLCGALAPALVEVSAILRTRTDNKSYGTESRLQNGRYGAVNTKIAFLRP